MAKTESITIEVPVGMSKSLNPINPETELIRNALLLYPHILNQTISHGRAAEILGIRKSELIDIYDKLGFSYLDSTIEELDSELETFRQLRHGDSEMPILLSFYNEGNIRMAVTDEEILLSWKKFFSEGTNWKDLGEDITHEQFQRITDKQHLSKARTMPMHYLKASGKGFFIDADGYAIALRKDLEPMMGSEAMKKHMKDIIEYRTMEYYRRRYKNGCALEKGDDR